MLIAPSYYPDFCCIADRCQHSCCVGWDVVVDEDTADWYRTVHGDFGKRLCDSLHTDADGDTVFSMKADGRCPFLNEKGLCDIILTLGEGALCQICDDHPRFYHTYSDRTEVGIGMSCEAAAKLMLSVTSTVTLETHEESDTAPTAEETAFFAVRDRLFAIVGDRSLSVTEREDSLLAAVGKAPATLSADTLCDLFLPLERLDDSWTTSLLTLREPPSYAPPSDIVLEQLLWYFLFRHTSDSLEDGRLAGRVAFAVHSARLLTELARRNADGFDGFCELCRQFSAEIEYSDENPAILFERFS